MTNNWSRDAAGNAISVLGLSTNAQRVADYWLSSWSEQGPPRRADFRPNRLAGLLSSIALFDVWLNERVRCRLAGSNYRFRFGIEITGRDWVELTRADQRKERLSRNTKIVQGAISSGLRSDPNRTGATRIFGDVQFPFAGTNEDGALTYLHYSEWRPQSDEFVLTSVRESMLSVAESFSSFDIVA